MNVSTSYVVLKPNLEMFHKVLINYVNLTLENKSRKAYEVYALDFMLKRRADATIVGPE